MLRHLTIQIRLAMIVTTLIIGLAILSAISLYHEYQSLYQQQQEKVQKIVEVGYSVLDYFYKQAESGKISEEEAKQQAIAAVQEIRYDGNNYMWINDMQPNMVVHPFKPALNGKPIGHVKDPDGTALFMEMIKQVQKSGAGFVPYKWPKPGFDDPVDKVSYVKGFKPWGWIIGSGLYIDNIEEIFAEKRNVLLLVALLVIITTGAFTYVVGKSVLVPMLKAGSLMRNIAHGDGDLTKELDSDGKDEISKLAKHFNNFVGQMRESLIEVSKTSDGVANTADGLSLASQSGSELIQAQSDNTAQVATAMEEMTANIREVSNNAEQAESATLEAQKNSSSGKEVIETAIHQIEGLSTDIDKVSEVITHLEQESLNIGSVLDVIRGIAEQTNLLALNAAIEAARAGEQGRGFAVVADEVRTLASRTAQSTDEIQHMIEKLQAGAKDAVSAVQVSQSTSSKTVEVAAEAQTMLEEVDNLMNIVLDMNSQIAKATEQQTHATDEINLRISELATLTQESVSHTEKLATTSDELKSRSGEMSNIVHRFKLT